MDPPEAIPGHLDMEHIDLAVETETHRAITAVASPRASGVHALLDTDRSIGTVGRCSATQMRWPVAERWRRFRLPRLGTSGVVMPGSARPWRRLAWLAGWRPESP